VPDVCTLAKALANGLPIGACLAKGQASTLLTAGMHGSTFGGNPLVCSAALAVLKTLDNEDLITKAHYKGAQITQQLSANLQNNLTVTDIRHQGLMIAIDFSRPCTKLVLPALKKGLLINVTNEKTIRLLPPLIINSSEIEHLVTTLSLLIETHTPLL
jgi:acetylornithine aminotransferase